MSMSVKKSGKKLLSNTNFGFFLLFQDKPVPGAKNYKNCQTKEI